MAKLYKLNDGDRELFSMTPKEPNIFTNFYMSGEFTGTWFRPTEETSQTPEIAAVIDRWKSSYDNILKKWRKGGRPEVVKYPDRELKVVIENDPDHPAFFHHHGFIFLPWQRSLWFAQQKTRIIIGGYGAAKSAGVFVTNAIRMATLRQYACFVVAEYSRQAYQVYLDAKNMLSGTEYEKRFIGEDGWKSRPYPQIIVKNDLCIESRMEFLSIEQNPEKIKNLQGDAFHIEQAEQFNNLDEVTEYLASRLRGHVGGRPRLGIMDYVANSDENGNPQLWDYFDEGETDPEHVIALQPETFDNIYITVPQLKEIERRIGTDPERRKRALKGKRPIGSGEHFSHETILKCRENSLDDIMRNGLEKELPGYKYLSVPKAQVVEWEIPPEDDKIYLLVADPGWSDPPNRNSAVIMVFDITHFPDIPAMLVAFHWVYGRNSPTPWISKYIELAYKFKCIGRNAFDSTGAQSGYNHMVHGLSDLMPWAIKLGGGTKFVYLNACKTLASHGKFQFPDIPMLFAQMAKYKLPDDKLRQDIVSCLIIAAAYLDHLFYNITNEEEQEPEEDDGRYNFHSRYQEHRRN